VAQVTYGKDDTADTMPAPSRRSSRPSLPSYDLLHTIGEGGMGEVMLAHACAPPTPDAVARFVCEAKIQAKPDHPAIVPVHAAAR
jgi:hypothetical protein